MQSTKKGAEVVSRFPCDVDYLSMTLNNDMLTYANAVAREGLDNTSICSDHPLGAALHCPRCWAWYRSRCTADRTSSRSYILGALQETRELAGEERLEVVAELLLEGLAGGVPTAPDFWVSLERVVQAAARLVRPTTRRRRAVYEMAAAFVSDPNVAVGP